MLLSLSLVPIRLALALALGLVAPVVRAPRLVASPLALHLEAPYRLLMVVVAVLGRIVRGVCWRTVTRLRGRVSSNTVLVVPYAVTVGILEVEVALLLLLLL